MEPLAPFNGTSEPMKKLATVLPRRRALHVRAAGTTFFTNPPLNDHRRGAPRTASTSSTGGSRRSDSGLDSGSGLSASGPDRRTSGNVSSRSGQLKSQNLHASAIASATSFVVAFPPRSGVLGPPSPSTRSIARTMRSWRCGCRGDRASARRPRSRRSGSRCPCPRCPAPTRGSARTSTGTCARD